MYIRCCMLKFAANTIYLSKSRFDSTFAFISTSQVKATIVCNALSWDVATVVHILGYSTTDVLWDVATVVLATTLPYYIA